MKLNLVAVTATALTYVSASNWNATANATTTTGLITLDPDPSSSTIRASTHQHPPQHTRAQLWQLRQAFKSHLLSDIRPEMAKPKKSGSTSTNTITASELRQRVERQQSKIGTNTGHRTGQQHERIDSALQLHDGQTRPQAPPKIERISWEEWKEILSESFKYAVGPSTISAYHGIPSWRTIVADPVLPLEQIPLHNQRAHKWNNFSMAAIAFLLIFGSLYSLCDYLLLQTRVSAQCTPTTVYLPTTMTVTTTELVPYSSNDVSPAGVNTQSSASPAVASTTSSFQFATPASTFSGTYVFSVIGSSTMWKDGISPTSGAHLTIATSTVTIMPTNSLATDLTTHTYITTTRTSTVSAYTTITLPTTTVTQFSVYSTALTTTSTSTRYVTYTMSAVTPKPSSFGGVGSGGWNASSAQAMSAESSEVQPPVATTITETHYYGADDATTSTSMNLITTTIGATLTTTLTPPATVVTLPGSGGVNSSTTFLAAPVTVTYTVQGDTPVLSTSVSFSQYQTAISAAAAAPPSYANATMSAGNSSMLASPGPSSTTSMTVSATFMPPSMASLVTTPSTLTFANSSMPTANQPGASITAGVATMSMNGSTAISAAGAGTSFAYSPPSVPPASSFAGVNASAASSIPLPPIGGPSMSVSVTGAPSSSALSASAGPANASNSSLSNQTTSTATLTTSTSLLGQTPSALASPLASDSISNAAGNFSTSTSSFSNPFPPTSATAIPSAGCGEQGNFTLNFDDLPTFRPSRIKRAMALIARQMNSTNGGSGGNDITQQPPLNLRPYHHLAFSNGFVYAPDTVEPFSPVSSPNVACFLSGVRTGSPSQQPDTGEIGDGPAPDSDSAFWFNLYSMYLGCDSPGPDPCIFEVTGLQWDAKAANETTKFAQNFTIPACPGFKDCKLNQVVLNETGMGLSGLEIQAVSAGKPRIWFMDDVQMAWNDTSCEAGLKRQRSR
ncbi:unnamed protein product [Zymoseptoria tritici ST99CH_1A5]|uniref:DUF7371 domain-containing protein n=1 Tax=Zymoseptoria tritici ST99CH_1A5 TaxID=1276529 RepID=A0A1Y6LKT4_ZYMTR|nr:unnamed protein product [Zymoseptoria tritici ST99CH_1A5]